MRHILIIIISIPLFSYLLVSCQKEDDVLYRWETSSGTVWKEIGDKGIHDYYEGELKNGKPHGDGVFGEPNV